MRYLISYISLILITNELIWLIRQASDIILIKMKLESRGEGDRSVRRGAGVMARFVKRGGENGAELGHSRGSRLESRGEGDRGVSRGAGVMARFAARSDDKSAWVGADRRVSSTLSVGSGSVFVPSISDRS